MNLRLVSQDDNTLTLGWDPVPGATGYRFTSTEFPGKHPHTWDPSRNTVKFHKGPEDTVYTVEAVDVVSSGTYPPAAPPPPPPPPTGKENLTEAQFQALVKAGATITDKTVSGGVTVNAPNVTIQRCDFADTVSIQPGGNGLKLLDGTALGFDLFGADDVLIQGNKFDGQGEDNQNLIWDQPAGNVPERFVIRGNSFTRFYIDDGVSHSEALYVGYSKDGLIENNVFTDNGNTAHIFFTWFGNTANPSTSYPRNICVRGNTFGPTHGAFFDVNLREEIPASAGIRVQADASITNPAFSGAC